MEISVNEDDKKEKEKEKKTNLGNVSVTEIEFFTSMQTKVLKGDPQDIALLENIKKKLYRGCHGCPYGQPEVSADFSRVQVCVTVQVQCRFRDRPGKLNSRAEPGQCEYVLRATRKSEVFRLRTQAP